MSLETEGMKNYAGEKMAEKQIMEDFAEAAGAAPAPAPAPTAANNFIRIDFSFLLKKTGSGAVSDPLYMDHPMNSPHSKGRARFLRGCTGIAGDLDLAIIDIALGSFEMIVEKRNGDGTA